jgi:hypothetical protein
MKIYYNPAMFPETPMECCIDTVEFISSDVNQIIIENEGDDDDWEELKCNPEGFLEHVEMQIYNSLDDEMKEQYANERVGLSDLVEKEFIILRPYLD